MTVDAYEDVISNSEATIGFILEIVPHQEPDKWLRKQNLIVGNKPTVAGTVLFADEPQAILPKRCGIKVYRYRTSDDEGTREALDGVPETIEGCAYRQVYAAVGATKRIIEGIRRMTPQGLISVEYPEETLHEIITNAILHRDYSIPDDIHIRIYDNRVEVESPGSLPGHITPKNILDERFARNGNLVRVINKFPNPPNKDVGEGLNTAFRAMKRLHLKEPEIVQRDSSVLVIIRHEQLASPEERIMTFLETHDSINNGQARDICVIREDWRIRSIFARMVEAGMIEKVPGSTTSNTAYRKIALRRTPRSQVLPPEVFSLSAFAAAVVASPVGAQAEFPAALAVAAPRQEAQAGIPAAQGVAVLQEDARTVPPLEDGVVAAGVVLNHLSDCPRRRL